MPIRYRALNDRPVNSNFHVNFYIYISMEVLYIDIAGDKQYAGTTQNGKKSRENEIFLQGSFEPSIQLTT